jgi:hypothetical protein
MVPEGEYDHALPLVRKLAYEDSSVAVTQYLRRVEAETLSRTLTASAPTHRMPGTPVCHIWSVHETGHLFDVVRINISS